MSGPEVTAICKGFDNSDSIFGSGVKIGGEKYFTIRADDKAIQGRKVPPAPVFTELYEAFFGLALIFRERKE